MKYRNEVKSDNSIINNANDLKIFLCKSFPGNSMSFIEVKRDNQDLEKITQQLDNVQVKTLSGNCTRTLHQIKEGEKKGNLLIRPFSCFCNCCLNDNFDKCIYKSITGGSFKYRELLSNRICAKDRHKR